VLRAAHRLDVDTSGLLVVARTREFAAHFAKQLRRPGRVRKRYGVLVEDRAVGDLGGGGGAPGSRGGQVQHLSAGTTLVHWTDKAQKRAPRCFVAKLPPPPQHRAAGAAATAAAAAAAEAEAEAEAGAEARRWQKCSLVVHSVQQHRVVVPTGGSSGKPEPEPPLLLLEVEPLEGRTHQIRGQLAAAGYPVQGDTYYGHGNSSEHQLALVASSIQFEDRAGVTVRETLPHPW
jgi:16S rRNA U516 pseudouridylate synthase RsuA-like enzyme